MRTYGAFIALEGLSRKGLVHKSQLSEERVEHPEEVVKPGDVVFVKVVELEAEEPVRIGLSMRAVDQRTREDLDPKHTYKPSRNKGGRGGRTASSTAVAAPKSSMSSGGNPRSDGAETEAALASASATAQQPQWGTGANAEMLGPGPGSASTFGASSTASAATTTTAGPDFAVSGKLTEEANTFKGVVIKYSEPPEARKPTLQWRLYPFKGEEALKIIYVHRQSAFLIGRDAVICDLPMYHQSISKQHAVLQYRLYTDRSTGRAESEVRPYIIDLDSTNKTFLNGEAIEPQRYYELRERDVLKFGFSSREYVVLNEKSAPSETN